MTEEDFPATIKLISGEEVFAIVQPHTENNKDFLLLYHPVVMKEMILPNGSSVLKIEPWLKSVGDEDTFLIERSNVMLLNECKDEEIIIYHKKFIKEKNKKGNEEILTKEQGYICNVKKMKSKLEEIFNTY